MVDFAKAHHPSNCLALNNRNRFGDGNAKAKTKNFTNFCTGFHRKDIDSIGCDDDGYNKRQCHRRQHQHQPTRCTINGNTVPNDYRRVNVQIYHGNSNRKKTIQDATGMWNRARTNVVNSCNLSVSVIFCAAISLLLLNIDVIKAEPQQTTEQQCEPKVLEETPPDPVCKLDM